MRRVACLLLLAMVLACGRTATGIPAAPSETPAPAGSPAATTAASPSPGAGAVDGNGDGVTPGPASASPASTRIPTPPGSRVPAPTSSTTGTPAASLEVTPGRVSAPAETLEAAGGPVVRVGGAAFLVELAIAPEQQIQGLSGRAVLAPDTGMLFVYQRESRYNFWMKEMRFPLDLVWIGANCTVVDITLDAPPPSPGQTLDQLPRYAPGVPAQYVLEINAGEAGSKDVGPGDPVEFTGALAGRHGC